MSKLRLCVSKLRLYISTAMHLKPSQIAYRVWRRLGGTTRLSFGYSPSPDPTRAIACCVPALPELDYDSAFLSRFDVEPILNDSVELLHHKESVDWETSWHMNHSTPLWRFNLHYCEYLLPLAKAYVDTGDVRYFDKGKTIVEMWISSCPRASGGIAWDPYVISMRVVNWLAFYGELRGELDADRSFMETFNRSLAEQFTHLFRHLEKDLLGNHYLENLKALAILSCYFDDQKTLDLALVKLYEQVNEQVLPDGMHFELSPMYHKIVLEDLLRVAVCLVARGHEAREVVERLRLQPMCDALWSLECNTNRTPLFNDSGDNVAKSGDSLLNCAQMRFGIKPVYRDSLPDAGYAILERNTDRGIVKLIFDAGRPGPSYAMGHVHCDALSFECYIDGIPWIVNGGTYAYQDEDRLKFKSTLLHSTIKVDGIEQHECWAPFRVAGFSDARITFSDGLNAEGELVQRESGATVNRLISLEASGLRIRDEVDVGHCIIEAFIFAEAALNIGGRCDYVDYSPEFGFKRVAQRVVMAVHDNFREIVIPYPDFNWNTEFS